jgi:hypothetical protein
MCKVLRVHHSALSWRFKERTGMAGADWIKEIADHPGNDIYFCNPTPFNEVLYYNFWLQGENSHPQFLAICQAFFKAVGLPEDELTNIYSSEQSSASNYFVGTPKFWATYLPWINQVLSVANKNCLLIFGISCIPNWRMTRAYIKGLLMGHLLWSDSFRSI